MAFFIQSKNAQMKIGLNLIPLWFGIVMILVVVSLAMAVSFTDFMDDRLYGNKRIFFIVLLFSYAVYRSFRLYHLIQKMKRDE